MKANDPMNLVAINPMVQRSEETQKAAPDLIIEKSKSIPAKSKGGRSSS